EELRELLELPPADQVVRHQDVVDPGVGHHLRLVQRLAGDAHGAELDLPPCDLDALVRLHVRAVGETDSVAVLLPAREIALEPVEIDDSRRRRAVEPRAGRFTRAPAERRWRRRRRGPRRRAGTATRVPHAPALVA